MPLPITGLNVRVLRSELVTVLTERFVLVVMPAASHAVSHVILLRTCIQVFWIDARWVVARV